MRNLKKFLALVLAMMMVMGLMVTANAATVKPDEPISDEYKDTVDILFELGILQGDNGAYSPKSNITRAQFATMLYRIHSGNTKDEPDGSYAKYAVADYTDVPAGKWYTNAVGYVTAMVLMEGDTSNHKFNPMDRITGAEVLTGLLRALGYDAMGELKDSNWSISKAISWGNIVGLSDDLTEVDAATLRYPATCETVAQLFFTTIVTDKVYWDDTKTPTGTPADYEKVSTPGVDTTLGKRFGLISTTTAADLDNIEGLDENPLRDDAFGRPSANSAVVVNGTVIRGERPQPIGEYVGDFTGADAKALGNGTLPTADKITVYYNGTPIQAADVATDWWVAAGTNGDNGYKGLWYDDTTGVPGYEVEVYTGDNDGEYRIIVCEAYVAEVAKAADDGKITVTAHWNDGGASQAVPVDGKHKSYSVLSDNQEGYVAVYLKGGTTILKAAGLAEVEVEDITRLEKGTKRKASAFIIADGEEYYFNNASVLKAGTYAMPISDDLALDAATLYLYNDKILLIDQTSDTPAPAATAKNTMYVVAQWEFTENTAFGPKDTKMFLGVLPNGETVVEEWTEATSGDIPAEATSGDIPVDLTVVGNTEKGYEYTVDDNGVYRFFESTGPEGIFVGSGSINATDVKLGSNYFASDVKFIVVEGNVTNGASTVKRTVKEGVQGVTLSGDDDYIVITKDANDNYVITTVFVRGNSITGGGTTTPDDLVYVASTDATGKAKDLKGEEVYEYTVYINGVAKTVMMGSMPAIGWYKQTIDNETGRTILVTDGVGPVITEKPATLVKIGDKYLVSAGGLTGLTDGVATNATVVDVSGNGINSISALYEKLSSKTVTISAQYDATSKVVTLIYVTAVTD